METTRNGYGTTPTNKLFDLPIRDGNKFNIGNIVSRHHLFDLPIRDGNTAQYTPNKYVSSFLIFL